MAEETTCFSCGNLLDVKPGNVGRSATCSHCLADLRACYNCQHYDSGNYNECSEPMAERIVEKHRANFCDYFRIGGGGFQGARNCKEEAKKKLDALFKK